MCSRLNHLEQSPEADERLSVTKDVWKTGLSHRIRSRLSGSQVGFQDIVRGILNQEYNMVDKETEDWNKRESATALLPDVIFLPVSLIYEIFPAPRF